MPKPYLHLHIHVVWSTWGRAPALLPDLRAPVHASSPRTPASWAAGKAGGVRAAKARVPGEAAG